MTVQKNLEVLKVMNLSLNRKDMIILGALLKAQRDPSAFVEFKALREQLALDEGGKKGKDSLIYRSLSWLEQTGLVRVNRSGYMHSYNSGATLMNEAMKQIIRKRTMELGENLQLMDTEIQLISDMKTDEIAVDLISLAAGTQPVEKPVFAEGWLNISKLLDDKIYRDSRKKDVIRFTLEWYNRAEELEELRLVNLESILKRGVEMRGLERKKVEKERIERYKRKAEYYHQLGYNVGFRVYSRKDSTYQFVARNSDGIVLIVSESPLSAAWFPRSANTELVDDAVRGFDEDYERGSDASRFGS